MNAPGGDEADASRPFRGEFAAAIVFAALYAIWLLGMNFGDGGDKSFIGFAIVPLALMALVLSLIVFVALKARSTLKDRIRVGGSRTGPMAAAAIASVAALVFMGASFNVVVHSYFNAPFVGQGAVHESARDFTTPWGARMIAVSFAPEGMHGPLAGRTLWVAETELTQEQLARLTGKPLAGQAQRAATALYAAQVSQILERANRDPGPAAPPGGRFRLPDELEAVFYSGDWWITAYPKTIYLCADGLGPVTEGTRNALGLRGTTDNAAELVVDESTGSTPAYCTLLGNVPPHCATDSSDEDERGNHKSVSVRYCTRGKRDLAFGHPNVGLRIVYSLDDRPKPGAP